MATCEDYLVQCPYNRSHMIRRSRIQQHLVKCERNYPELMMEWCPHNASHRFARREDYLAHIPNCPDARISSDALIAMTLKYHEMGDICEINHDPDRRVGAGEDWSDEYDSFEREYDVSSVGDTEVCAERQNVSDASSGRGSCESEDGDVDDIANEMASLDIDGEVSFLDRIKSYSPKECTHTTYRMQSDDVQMPSPKKSFFSLEDHYSRGICIGRGHTLPWLDGKPGKSTYQKTVEHQELDSESVEMSVGRGFSRFHHLKQNPQCLRKPLRSYESGW